MVFLERRFLESIFLCIYSQFPQLNVLLFTTTPDIVTYSRGYSVRLPSLVDVPALLAPFMCRYCYGSKV